ncbi:type II secretion system protein GspC [Alteromonas sp. ASW11-36]|uniref:Type II secretion system protein GspC n=1 Tax=Alteromonas arenosi TaxID=3055817 RepID=A0ABT7T0X9_9ALTE|nr:type II secretion system protein GspC [Alteromonas sp. ASW11-36]MDM7862083.1 type II secretion system protein GspC [Alteromonas sp. ASW11-36]
MQAAISFINQRQSLINSVIVALLAIYLIAYLAELTWRLIPAPESATGNTAQRQVDRSTRPDGSQINLTAIKRLNLFGEFNQQVTVTEEESVTDAPETSLNLVLTGVVASTQESNGAAIIEHRGDQQTYGIGEKIEGTNATLREVFSDRVIIRNGARNETLMLDGIDFDEANRSRRQTARTQPQRSEPTPQPRLSDEALEATQQLREQPASFTDFISISQVQVDGQLLGYRVQPGKNPALFTAAGLVAGDVITEINGFDVTDPQQAREALGELRTADALQLTVLRDEQFLTLYLDLPETSDEE